MRGLHCGWLHSLVLSCGYEPHPPRKLFWSASVAGHGFFVLFNHADVAPALNLLHSPTLQVHLVLHSGWLHLLVHLHEGHSKHLHWWDHGQEHKVQDHREKFAGPGEHAVTMPICLTLYKLDVASSVEQG